MWSDNWPCSYPRRGSNRRELIKPDGLLLSAVAEPRIGVMYRFLIKTHPQAATSLRLSLSASRPSSGRQLIWQLAVWNASVPPVWMHRRETRVRYKTPEDAPKIREELSAQKKTCKPIYFRRCNAIFFHPKSIPGYVLLNSFFLHYFTACCIKRKTR